MLRELGGGGYQRFTTLNLADKEKELKSINNCRVGKRAPAKSTHEALTRIYEFFLLQSTSGIRVMCRNIDTGPGDGILVIRAMIDTGPGDGVLVIRAMNHD